MSNADPSVAASPSTPPDSTSTGGSTFVKAVLWTVGILAGTCGVLAIVGMLLPSQYSVERSVVVDAAPQEVHAQIVDLKAWPKWNAEHSGREYQYPGQVAGEGAVLTWTEPNLPDAKLTLTYQNPTEGIQYTLQTDGSDEPLKGTIRYAPEEGGTRVTWRARGTVGNNPVDRWRVFLITRTLVREFETGLENLKPLAEKLAAENRKKGAAAPKTAAKKTPGRSGPGGVAGGSGGGRKRPGGKRGSGKFNAQQIVDRLMENDKNKDGKLSKDEIPERAQRLIDFAAADTDKDGLLSKDELLASMRNRRGRGKTRGKGGPRKRRPTEDNPTAPNKKPATKVPNPREEQPSSD